MGWTAHWANAGTMFSLRNVPTQKGWPPVRKPLCESGAPPQKCTHTVFTSLLFLASSLQTS